jgi:glycosyltransferase involved in cell wall biosynthesis
VTQVSVGLPVYNAECYLAQALDDLLVQTHTDLEIVISDNGSTDRTQEICEQYAAKDSRIRYLRHDRNRGLAWNHNEAVKNARGAYFRWYAYDDRLDPKCIEACAAVLDANPDVILAWPLTTVIDGAGEVSCQYRDDLPFDNSTPTTRLRSLLGSETEETHLHMCYPNYGVMRRDVLLRTHMHGTMPGADTVLLCELALRGPWELVPQRLFYNRRHADSSAIDKSAEELAAYLDTRHSGAFPMPITRLFIGYLRAVLTAPLAFRERLRCLGVVANWFVSHRRWRIIGGEFKIRGRQLLTRLTLAVQDRRAMSEGVRDSL